METRNLIGYFETQDEALAVVREVLDTYRVEETMSFALGVDDENGGGKAIAEGPELVELARAYSARVKESV